MRLWIPFPYFSFGAAPYVCYKRITQKFENSNYIAVMSNLILTAINTRLCVLTDIYIRYLGTID